MIALLLTIIACAIVLCILFRVWIHFKDKEDLIVLSVFMERDNLIAKLDAEHRANLDLAARAAKYDEMKRRLRLRRKERGF